MSRRSGPAPASAPCRPDRLAGAGWEDVGGLALRKGFAHTMYALAALYLLAAAVDVAVLGVTVLCLSLLLTSAFMAGSAQWQRTRPMRTTTLHSLTWLIVLAIVSAWTAHAVVLSLPSFGLLMAGTLIAAAVVLPGRRVFVLADLVVLIGFGSVALTRLDDPDWVVSGLSVLLGIAVAHVLQVFTDTGRRHLQEMASGLAADAMHDPLTGLLNRQGLHETLHRQFRPRADGALSAQPLAVLCFDVNGFKTINDELGHAVGDLVLIELAAQMRGLMRPGDSLARTGGDEFVLLVVGATAEGGVRVRDQARLCLRGAAGVLQLPWSVSVGSSFGTVLSSAEVEELQRAADLAMYVDKRAFRARSADLVLDPPGP